MRRAGLLAFACLAALAVGAPASAQIFGGARQDREIEALQRDVATIQLQLNGANGQPGLAAGASAARDGAERAQGRIDDLEASLRTMNGTVESLTTDLATTRRALEASDERNRDLSERLTRLETAQSALREQMARAETPAPAAAEPDAQSPAGEPPAGAAPATADAAFAAARAANGDPPVAEAQWAGFIAAWPRDPRVAQANHFLGEARYTRQDWAGAAAAYATSLRGWPTTPWAAESTLKLADALGRLNRTQQACAALGEFDTRYAASASARGRQRAATQRQTLSCP